ncbi:MAG: Gp138 family membrane-puncturing spike protein [Phycisphaerales bacterium]|jgi:hypothetical protein
MSSTDKALTEVLEDAMTAVLQRVGGPLIGKVDTYDPATATAQVTPVVPLYVDDELVTPPKLYSVPVLWPASTAHRIHFPLTAGSIVELTPLGHDHSQWLTTGTAGVAPPSTRRVSLADLVAIPMAPSPTNQPPPAGSYDTVWGVLYGLWIAGSSSATDFAAMAGKVLTELNNIAAEYNAHIHAGPGGNTGTPLSSDPPFDPSVITPSSVACTKLKVE